MRSIGKITGVLLSLVMLMTIEGGLGVTLCQGANFLATGSMATARYGHTATLLPNRKILIAGGAFNTTLASAELYDPATGTFTTTGSMITARYGHTASILPNGKVLIAGGAASNGLPSAELYDPDTGTFTVTGSMVAARNGHTATPLNSGKVLICGGTYSGSAELYDPDTGEFTATGSFVIPRSGHTATLLSNGKVLVVGGWDYLNARPTSSAELYDPATGSFSAIGSMSAPRSYPSATLLQNGKVLIAGGTNSSGWYINVFDSAELYDPTNGTFTVTGNMVAARFGQNATLLSSGKVLLTGGRDGGMNAPPDVVQLYDPVAGTFTAAGNMTTTRSDHSATLLPSGKVFIAGGSNNINNNYKVLTSAEIYDPVGGSFSTTGSMTKSLAYHTSTILSSGKVLIAGGQNTPSYNYDPSAKLYDPDSGTFTATGNMAVDRMYHTATLLPNGKVLIAGGSSSASGSLASAELYDLVTGIFIGTGSMTIDRLSHTATLLSNGKILIAGGYGNSGGLSSAELYDPATGTFAPTGSMTIARSSHTATLLPNGKVLIAGDGSLEVYDPVTGIFTAIESKVTALYSHTATLLPTGKVLIAGGYNGSGYSASGELYDPATGSVTTTGSMAIGRTMHTATLLTNGKVLVAGGNSNSNSVTSAELYDPDTGTFTPTGSMSIARTPCATTLLHTGKVLFTGGIVYGYNINPAIAELYDPGIEFTKESQPVISSIAFDSNSPTQLVVTGNRLQGSAGEPPRLQLQRVDNDQTSFLSPSDGSDIFFRSPSVYGLPVGTYRATIIANAIPSEQRFITIAPVISVTPTSWNFGNVFTGTTSEPATFTISNNGSADLVISAATVGGRFSVGTGTCGTFPTTLPPATSCTVTATFSPTTVGVSNANLTLTTNDPTTPVTVIPLTGTGTVLKYQLNISASPAGSGVVSPATGGWYPVGTVVPIKVIPNKDYAFSSWSGPAAKSTSASTTVTMTGPITVTANLSGLPLLTAAIGTTKSGTTNARLWPITLTNSGKGTALSAKIDSLTLTQTFGTACTPIVKTPLPTFGNIAAGVSLTGSATIDFSSCNATARFTAVVTYSASNGGGGSKTFVNQFR